MIGRLGFIAGVALVTIALSIAGAGTAYADDDGDDGEFRWMACAGMTQGGFLGLSPVGCPDAALASNGDMIEITGEGTLEVDDGEPEDVSGGGSYRHTDISGDVLDVGTFTARRLKSFESFGSSNVLPESFNLGEALIGIRMVSDFDGKVRKAKLLVGCILPDPVEPERVPADLIEGIRLNVKGGPNFDLPPPPNMFGLPQRATLFIELDDDDD